MTAQKLHAEKIRAIVDEYQRNGYVVEVEPRPESIPGFDRSLQPDLVVKKDGIHTVIEVESRSGLRASDAVRRMADAIAKSPGWNFELVLLEDATVLGDTQLDIDSIPSHLAIAELAMDRGFTKSAFIMFWVVLEATLRMLAADHGVEIGDDSPDRLFRELSFNGLLSAEDTALCAHLLRVRNQIVHGFEAAALSTDDITVLRDLIVRVEEQMKKRPAAA